MKYTGEYVKEEIDAIEDRMRSYNDEDSDYLRGVAALDGMLKLFDLISNTIYERAQIRKKKKSKKKK